jgi:glutamate transport system permease protein
MTTTLFEIPGPRERRSIRAWTAGGAVPIIALVVVAVVVLKDAGLFAGDDWAVLGRTDLLMALLRGVGATLKAAAFTVVLSLVFGLLLALGRMSHQRWINVPARIWVETLRGLPELLLVFFIYLGVPAATGFNISTFWALVVGLVLYESTSMAEVFRGGFLALPRGQTEAAHAMGLRTVKTLRFVQLPQVVPQVLPSLVSEMVRVTKASSLGFVIGYTDLLLTGELAIEYLGGEYAAPVFAAVAALYVVICLLLTRLSHYLSERLGS